jgi:hypothetical protein
MKKRSKIILIIVSTIIILFTLDFFYGMSRKYFYITEDKCITVWKTPEGAFIIPGKYTSWFKPKDNYIKTDNSNAVTILYCDKEPQFDYIISNDFDKNMEIHMSKYKIKYYEFKDRESSFAEEYYENNMMKPGVDGLSIDIRELH